MNHPDCRTGSPSVGTQHPRNESGIILVLALLVMVVLIVLVSQLFYSSQVDLNRSEHAALELQMEKLAEAAMRKSQVVLIVDLEEESGGDPIGGAGGGAIGGGDGGATGAIGGVPGAGGGGDGGGAAAVLDSLDESWALGDVPFDLGQDVGLETRIYIVDEDRKINLLLLAAEEEKYREEWRARMIRALDLLRDGKERDLSASDADTMIRRFEGWMLGERDDRGFEKPPVAEGPFLDDRAREFYAPMSLAEFCLPGGVTPSMLYGFETRIGSQREWVPGLTDIFTVWSNLKFEDDEVGDPSEAGNGPGNAADPSPGAEPDPEEKESPAPGVNNGRVNINTSPIAVLRSLLPEDELPAYAWEEFEEFRKEQIEKLIEARDDPLAEVDTLDPRDEGGPVYPLETIDDLRLFDAFSESNSVLSSESWKKLASLLSVESHVFSITVVVATQEPPHHYYVARSVVWRRTGENGPEIIPVKPFERLPVAAIDLRKLEKELEEYEGYGGFGSH